MYIVEGVGFAVYEYLEYLVIFAAVFWYSFTLFLGYQITSKPLAKVKCKILETSNHGVSWASLDL